MRLLLDNNLPRRLADYFRDAEHVGDHGLRAASDEEVLQFATLQDRVLVSADTDFGTLLAHGPGTSLDTKTFSSAAARGTCEEPDSDR